MNAPSAPELGADVYLKDSVAGHYQRARKHVCITMPPDRQTLTNLLEAILSGQDVLLRKTYYNMS